MVFWIVGQVGLELGADSSEGSLKGVGHGIEASAMGHAHVHDLEEGCGSRGDRYLGGDAADERRALDGMYHFICISQSSIQ
jgi:hypothetical protein